MARAGVPIGSLLTLPLTWGEAGSVERFRRDLRERLGGDTDEIDFILAADVVYHDPLIVPLIETLIAFTDPPSQASPDWKPPSIIISYVQRFKRAKRFFKLASVHFDIEVVAGSASSSSVQGGGACVDYDSLTWTLPKVLSLLPEGTHQREPRETLQTQRSSFEEECSEFIPLVKCKHASYSFFSQLLENAARVKNEKLGERANLSAGKGTKITESSILANTKHGIDSDSGDEWEDPNRFSKAFASSVGGDALFASEGSLQDPISLAAQFLSVSHPPPSQAYIYILKRKGK